MNVVGMHRRIRKLESSIPGGIGAWTYDELCVRILESSTTAAVETIGAEEREQWKEAIAEIEDDMIRLAAKQASSDYAKHLEWCRKMWGGGARSALMKQVEKQAFRQTPGPAVDA